MKSFKVERVRLLTWDWTVFSTNRLNRCHIYLRVAHPVRIVTSTLLPWQTAASGAIVTAGATVCDTWTHVNSGSELRNRWQCSAAGKDSMLELCVCVCVMETLLCDSGLPSETNTQHYYMQQTHKTQNDAHTPWQLQYYTGYYRSQSRWSGADGASLSRDSGRMSQEPVWRRVNLVWSRRSSKLQSLMMWETPLAARQYLKKKSFWCCFQSVKNH